MTARGKGQKQWQKSKTVKTLGKRNAAEAAEIAAAQQAVLDAESKAAAARERLVKRTPKPNRAVDPAYHKSDRQDLR